jgi:hypothetical protein
LQILMKDADFGGYSCGHVATSPTILAAMRRYRYVGPDDIRDAARTQPAGTPITSRADLAAWAGERTVTFVVTPDGTLRVAPRRSEHIACASAGDVLAAGELEIANGAVIAASNQSTGFCPEPTCWTELAAALDRAGIARPAAFTHAFVFRRCPECGERNIVKDDHFECAMCGAELPAEWNFE